jgi:hypothetical protein
VRFLSATDAALLLDCVGVNAALASTSLRALHERGLRVEKVRQGELAKFVETDNHERVEAFVIGDGAHESGNNTAIMLTAHGARSFAETSIHSTQNQKHRFVELMQNVLHCGLPDIN